MHDSHIVCGNRNVVIVGQDERLQHYRIEVRSIGNSILFRSRALENGYGRRQHLLD